MKPTAMAPAQQLKVIKRTKGLLIKPIAIINKHKTKEIYPVAPKALCASWVTYTKEVNNIILKDIKKPIPNHPNISWSFMPCIKLITDVELLASPVKL